MLLIVYILLLYARNKKNLSYNVKLWEEFCECKDETLPPEVGLITSGYIFRLRIVYHIQRPDMLISTSPVLLVSRYNYVIKLNHGVYAQKTD